MLPGVQHLETSKHHHRQPSHLFWVIWWWGYNDVTSVVQWGFNKHPVYMAYQSIYGKNRYSGANIPKYVYLPHPPFVSVVSCDYNIVPSCPFREMAALWTADFLGRRFSPVLFYTLTRADLQVQRRQTMATKILLNSRSSAHWFTGVLATSVDYFFPVLVL